MQPRVYVYGGFPLTVEVLEFGHVFAKAPPAPIVAIARTLAAATSVIRILCRGT
jgi:hypothetical protein